MIVAAACLPKAAGAHQAGQVGYRTGTYAPGPIGPSIKLVPIVLVARDSGGRPIAGVKPGKLNVEDAGHAVRIQHFKAITRGHWPAEIGIFLDDTHLPTGGLNAERASALVIARAGLAHGATITLSTASHSLRLDGSRDLTAIRSALARVRQHPFAIPAPVFPCPQLSPFEAFALLVEKDPAYTQQIQLRGAACPESPKQENDLALMMRGQALSIWDVVAAHTHETLASVRDLVAEIAEQGQPAEPKTVWILSSGFLAAQLGREQDMITDEAIRAAITIDALVAGRNGGPGFVDDLPTPLSEPQAREAAMLNLAASTGGVLVRGEGNLADAIARWGMVPSIKYRLEYEPQDTGASGAFRPLQFFYLGRIGGLTLQARSGYFAHTPDALATLDQQLLNAAMRQMAEGNAVPAVLTEARTAHGIGITAHVNLKVMPFAACDDHSCQTLLLAAGVYRKDGSFETGQQQIMEMSVESATLERLRAHGAVLSLELPLTNESERLRVVLLRQSDGALSTFNRYLDIH